MESKFTPGPWSLETVKTSSGICHKIGPFPWKEGRQNHACIYVDYPNGAMGTAEAELKANATLIASAPDLLEACEAAVKCSDDLAERYGWERVDEAEAVHAQLRAAISKARGNQS